MNVLHSAVASSLCPLQQWRDYIRCMQETPIHAAKSLHVSVRMMVSSKQSIEELLSSEDKERGIIASSSHPLGKTNSARGKANHIKTAYQIYEISQFYIPSALHL